MSTTAPGAQAAADALLRSLGATQIALRMPGSSSADATSTQLGVAPVPTQDVTLEPALVASRPLAPDSSRQLSIATTTST